MKRLLLFTLTLCFCINIQAKESTVVYKLSRRNTLSITGNFEKGLLTEGHVKFSFYFYELIGEYSPQSQTFRGKIKSVGNVQGDDCYGTIYTTNGKPISKKTVASEWMIELHLGVTVVYGVSAGVDAKAEFNFIGTTPLDNESNVWNRLSNFMYHLRERATHYATVYFSNGNKYIGPVYYDGHIWHMGKEGCTDCYYNGGHDISKNSFSIKYFWNNGDSFEGVAILYKDWTMPISGKMTYYNGIIDQTWKLSSKDYPKFTFNKNPTQLKEELLIIEAEEKARLQQEQEEKARRDSLELAYEKQKHEIEQQKKEAFVRKYGQQYGSLIYQGKLELGMTQQMCREVINIKSFNIGKSIEFGHRVETWTFNYDKAMGLAFLLQLGPVTPKYSILVFTDGKLTSFY